MNLPVQIAFHGLAGSAKLTDLVNEEAARLEHLYRDVVSCRVAIERLSARHRHGNPLRVRIEVGVPGKRFVVDSHPTVRPVAVAGGDEEEEAAPRTRASEAAPEHKDDSLAVRDAFRKMARRLEDFARRQRGDVKAHPEVRAEARVTKLFAAEGYGFLETGEGREVYFHRESVIEGDFDRLAVGARVRFAEEEGDDGPQASMVRAIV